MEALVLRDGEEPVFDVLLDRPVEVGSSPGCDIIVHDRALAPRALLVRPDGARVLVHSLAGGRIGPPRPLARDEPLWLGGRYSLVRVEARELADMLEGGRTERVESGVGAPGLFALLVGRGPEPRRHRITRPLQVGSDAAWNDVVLADPAVSARHLRLEPGPDGVTLRDLSSRNGTWVDGVRVTTARIGAGSRVRVGRTDLTLVRSGGVREEVVGGLVVASPAMQRLMAEVERVASLDWPVLVAGPSGSGKERIARELHERGRRRDRPFVALNAGAFPRDMIESELFGHERGAFTGAERAHRGVLEQADGGTLFLDEIGELPLPLQARLLRVVEGWEVRRVGAEGVLKVDVRLVCATHRDLRRMVLAGEFREDLYFRIASLVLEVPPLAARPEDLRALSARFVAELTRDLGEKVLGPDAAARLASHSWPGNVRELRNVLASAALASPTRTVTAADVDGAIARVGAPAPRELLGPDEALRAVVASHEGNLAAAARALGVPRETLRDRVKGVAKSGGRRPSRRTAVNE